MNVHVHLTKLVKVEASSEILFRFLFWFGVESFFEIRSSVMKQRIFFYKSYRIASSIYGEFVIVQIATGIIVLTFYFELIQSLFYKIQAISLSLNLSFFTKHKTLSKMPRGQIQLMCSILKTFCSFVFKQSILNLSHWSWKA